jgi:hypothetical protein
MGDVSPSAARRAARIPAPHRLLRSCVRRRSLPSGSRAAGSGLVASTASAPSTAPSSPAGGPDG